MTVIAGCITNLEDGLSTGSQKGRTKNIATRAFVTSRQSLFLLPSLQGQIQLILEAFVSIPVVSSNNYEDANAAYTVFRDAKRYHGQVVGTEIRTYPCAFCHVSMACPFSPRRGPQSLGLRIAHPLRSGSFHSVVYTERLFIKIYCDWPKFRRYFITAFLARAMISSKFVVVNVINRIGVASLRTRT